MPVEKTMDKIVALCKNRGFIYPGSEIYGGLANAWDYGHLGVELKNNIKRAWWKKFIQESPHNVGIECAILMNPQVWVASGHVAGFSDPLIDCKECKSRFRADKLIENWNKNNNVDVHIEGWSDDKMLQYINQNNVSCPDCGKTNFTTIRKFNLMYKTYQGVTEESKSEIFLRPETAQGMFVNFKNVQRTTRRKIPFGIGQIGRSFRNEITPGNFIFRTREFEQMELEFFCEPDKDTEWFDYWRDFCYKWLLDLGLNKQNIRFREHAKQELSHYSKATTDFEFLFPFGWGELWGIANRTDYDLKQHSEHSGDDLSYFDPETNQKYMPYCIEPAVGVDRLVLAFLSDSYDEEQLAEGDTRIVLRFHNFLAPVKIAVLPLSNKLSDNAWSVYENLKKSYNCDFDKTGSIGKRYRRQDEIGTPYCITYDFDSLNDNSVTIRERDSMQQVRININELENYFTGKFDI